MRPRPPSLIPLTILGASLGLLLSLEGLSARLYGQFLLRNQADPWWQTGLQTLLAGDRLDLYEVGWLPLVVGTAWFGSLAGLWLKHRWGRHAVLVLAALSALQEGAFTILGAVTLAVGFSASIRRWVEAV